MIRFAIEVDGLPEFDRSFNRVTQRIEDLRPVWDAVEKVFFELETEQFRSEGSAGGSGQWPALSHQYEEAKAKAGYNFLPILQRSRALYFSLTRKGAEHQVLDEGAQELTIGTTLPYAALHQRGAGRLKARPPISLSEAGRRRIQKAIQRELVQFVRRAGFVVTEENIGEFPV